MYLLLYLNWGKKRRMVVYFPGQQAAETRKPEFHYGYNILVLQQLQRLSTKLGCCYMISEQKENYEIMYHTKRALMG